MLTKGFLQKVPIFDDISASDREVLVSGSSIVDVKNKDFLFRSGETAEFFGFVMSGGFKLIRKTPVSTILDLAISGDPIALLLMNSVVAKFPIDAQAIGPSQFLKLPKEVFQKKWITHEVVSKRFNDLVVRRCVGIHEDRSSQSLPLSARVAKLLLRIHSRTRESNQLSVKLTRQDIADVLGASVESVIRIMSNWEKGEILLTKNQMITILDSKALEEAQNTP